MRILLIGATGTIGKHVAEVLGREYEIIPVGRRSTPITVDIADPPSIAAMFGRVGEVDAVISAAGGTARRKSWQELSDHDFELTLRSKLMGQVNLVRLGIDHVRDGGSFTLTSGILGRAPMPGSAAISLANLGLEGFAAAAALEMPRRIRINVVSPPWVTETLEALAMSGVDGLPAAAVARSYAEAVTGRFSGRVLAPATHRDGSSPIVTTADDTNGEQPPRDRVSSAAEVTNERP